VDNLLSENNCRHCGRSDVIKANYVLMGIVAGLLFGIAIFTLGFYFKVANV
jgi:hypothetical protein